LFRWMQIFELPTWITMAIAATRMHRALVDSASSATDVYDILHSLAFPANCGRSSFSVPGNRRNSNLPPQEKKWINATSTPTDGTELTTHIVTEQSEQSRTLQTREDGSCISTDKYMTMHVKQNGLFCDDAERSL